MPDDPLLPEEAEPPGATPAPFSHNKHLPDKFSYWHDWRWQMAHRIKTVEELSKFLFLTPSEIMALKESRLPMSITPYYARLLDPVNDRDPLRRTVVPTLKENTIHFGEEKDPLSEERDTPVEGLVHRYPDRVLLLATNGCATYCRYCTRSRLVGKEKRDTVKPTQWGKALDYIRAHREIRDVLVSGGDPLTLSDAKLGWLLQQIRQIPHVEIIRIGTKVPIVLPQRITPHLVKLLRRFHPLFMSIHVTHPRELTEEVSLALNRLADSGIPLGSQTVLLKNINDDVDTIKQLMQGLLKMRVRPYYLYQCDPILGSAHFRTPVSKGLEIIKGLRGFTSGYAVPHYVIDAPGGGGKIPLLPEYVVGREGNYLILRNYEGKTFVYPDYL